MSFFDHPTSRYEVISTIAGGSQTCEIRNYNDEAEQGDLIILRCGNNFRVIGRALKGLSEDKINGCSSSFLLHAVHRPKFILVNNCGRHLTIIDLGSKWISKIARDRGIRQNYIEYVSYSPINSRQGCYKVSVVFDRSPSLNTTYMEENRDFCI